MEDSGSSPSGVTGGPVDISGLSFTATYDDESTGSVMPSSYTPTSFGDTVGTQTVTFSFEGTDITVDVDYDVEEAEVDSVVITGTPVRQHSFTQVDSTGLTVTGHWTNGQTTDVTSDATFTNTQNHTDEWGSCLVYSESEQTWVLDTADYAITAEVNAKEANTSLFKLPGQFDDGGHSDLPNATYQYATFNLDDVRPDDPWDGAEGGYLIEGASIGDYVWMLFTKSQYDNDTGVDITAFGGTAQSLGAELEGSVDQPAFSCYTNGTRNVFCVSVDGTGTLNSEFVLVVGSLNHAVTAGGAGTIQKSYFDYTGENAARTFTIKLIDPS